MCQGVPPGALSKDAVQAVSFLRFMVDHFASCPQSCPQISTLRLPNAARANPSRTMRTGASPPTLCASRHVAALSSHISGVGTVSGGRCKPSRSACSIARVVASRQSGYPGWSVSHMPPTWALIPRRYATAAPRIRNNRWRPGRNVLGRPLACMPSCASRDCRVADGPECVDCQGDGRV
jgi:hypothetical protein